MPGRCPLILFQTRSPIGGGAAVVVPNPTSDPPDELLPHVPAAALDLALVGDQTAIPAIAKSVELTRQIENALAEIPSAHRLIQGDSRILDRLVGDSVHLVVTSPPYWTLKAYPARTGQLGWTDGYEDFLDQLDAVWRHVYRLLVPGGRLVVVVGDVCIPRRQAGRHVVYPLHASIQERCRAIGFDNLAPIIWHKIANVQLEAGRSSRFLGKPYEPNAVVKNDIEYILFQRKPGAYRSPSLPSRILSVIPEAAHHEWFQQIWHITGASTKRHPAPFPLTLAERLIRMFSFVGDTVLDPFVGSGTTCLAASLFARHSVGVDVEPSYIASARDRFAQHHGLVSRARITVETHP